MNRDEARQYFEDCGLSYSSIREDSIQVLYMMLVKKVKECSKEYWENDYPGCYYEVSKKIVIKKNKDGSIKFCELMVNSHYFTQREGICFNPNGFIGFAGWSDNLNVEPLINAFVEWVDWMKDSAAQVKLTTIKKGEVPEK